MRLKLMITGLVQGVGFRPFIYRLAREIGLKGYVLNDTSGVTVDVEGEKEKLDTFLVRIEKERPHLSRIYSLQHSFLKEAGFDDFIIRRSKEEGIRKVPILPDIATCDECLKEINDPEDRRFMYPFTNCTNCGPRFTIIEALPYDRKNTSMKAFRMCRDCEREYNHPPDRRFHAQPDACPACGPWINLYDREGRFLSSSKDGDTVKTISRTVEFIKRGYIIAIKGLGGFHLVCDATNEETVKRLRQRKRREERPLAVMFPDLDSVKAEAYVSLLEERALSSVERPIVILRKHKETTIAESVAPDNSTIGAFLPYTPLHHLILQRLKGPVVATSANVTDEPIVKDEADALERLKGIADYILSHNREIVRRCDDSVVRIMAGRQVPIRRSRGFAPMPVIIPFRLQRPILALGAHMNTTIALGMDNRVYLSQHIGDLDTPLARQFFEEVVDDLLRLFDVKPEIVVSDMHPGYFSTRFGKSRFQDRLVMIQHHFAHILSCMVENEITPDEEIIGFAFDGTGYGTDNTIWGGEVLMVSYRGFRRVFHLLPFRLPGGERAIKEPYRTAISLLYEAFGEKARDMDIIPDNTRRERAFLIGMIRRGINSPVTTSMGRLFDGVSAMIGLKQTVSYHAQAPILLESSALDSYESRSYPFVIKDGIIDYRPAIRNIVNDLESGTPPRDIARMFHNTVIDIIIQVSESIRQETGLRTVALSGGVFQNSILLENTIRRLKEKGFIPLIHQMVPPNDGGISLGQVVAAQFKI